MEQLEYAILTKGRTLLLDNIGTKVLSDLIVYITNEDTII